MYEELINIPLSHKPQKTYQDFVHIFVLNEQPSGLTLQII